MIGGHEFSETLPYNLSACVEQTGLEFPDTHSARIGAGGYWRRELLFYAEQRFLEPSQIQIDRSGTTFPQVTQVLRASIPAVPATTEHLNELRLDAEADKLRFGPRIMRDAGAVKLENPKVIRPV